MLSPAPDQPATLTAAADLAGLIATGGITEVLTGAHLTFRIHGPDGLPLSLRNRKPTPST
jgi:hypothetical protein